jgi:TonB family protein
VSGRSHAAAFLLAAFIAWPNAALAQDKPVPAPGPVPSLAPPIVQGRTDVPYPKGGQGDAIVLLELTIENNGTVSRAVVAEGVEPFAEQARQAVLGWRFTPALRGGNAVGARIRARVEFRQEEVPSAPPRGSRPAPMRGAASTTLSASAQPSDSPEEVNVHGTRREIGQTTLSATDVREMPGAFGDPFRAIEALPGVVPLTSGLPYFYVRGAPPNNNGCYVDGIRVPLLFHVGIGQGVIHPALIDHVDFYPGAAPASYGGFAGATIAGQTREPATTWHGEASLRVIDAGALVEAPIDDGRFTVLAAGRYGYPGPILSAITSNVSINYWDYQTRATWRVGDRDTLGVFVFGSHDYLATQQSSGGGGANTGGSSNAGPSSSLQELLVSDFHRLDLRWDHGFANGDGHVRVGATLGYDSQGATPTYATNYSAATRLEIEGKLSPTFRVRGGADARYDDYGFEQGAAVPGPPVDPSTANPPPTNVTWGAHADVVWRLSPRVEIVPGVRFDVFQSTRAAAPGGTSQVSTIVPAFDPRLSTRVTLTDSVAWLSTFGLSHQYPALRIGSIPPQQVSVPGFPFGVSQVQTVAQASQGVEVALPADFTATITGFLSAWSGLTDLTAECVQLSPPNGPYQCPADRPVHGRAYGLELLVRRPLSKRLTGWLSYTLSRATRETHFLTPSGREGTATIVGDYDRTHVLNVMGAYDLGRRWRLGARFVVYTGSPYSDNFPRDQGSPLPPLNDRRYPPFYRVDVRLEKRWSLGKERSIAFVAEVLNATLSKEGRAYDCQAVEIGSANSRQCAVQYLGPITLPSVGVEAFF